MFLSLDFKGLYYSSADNTPFYPAVASLFSAITGSVEGGARLCSLFFSSVVFLSIIGIGRKIATSYEIALALILLACGPYLVRFSFSVLTEPSYVGTIYAGFWLFWYTQDSPKLKYAFGLGLIFALGFLNRIEGILYLAAIPLFQLLHFFTSATRQYSGRQLSGWISTFVIVFCLVSAAQVWRVSDLMGSPSLNGRQTWSLVLNNNDTRSYRQKVFGLDYSPGQINLHYLREHPEARETLVSNIGFLPYVISYAKVVVHNLRDLLSNTLGTLIGPFGLIFFMFGLVALGVRDRYYEIFLIVGFVGLGLAAPLVHDVAERHIAIIGPLMILLNGIGIFFLAERIARFIDFKFLNREVMAILLLCTLLAISAVPLKRTLLQPLGVFSAYRASELEKPVALIKAAVNEELGRPANVVASKSYLPFYSESRAIPLPATDYAGLVRYMNLNEGDFLFLDRWRLTDHRFRKDFFEEKKTPDFQLLYTGKNRWGEIHRLYRFTPRVLTKGSG